MTNDDIVKTTELHTKQISSLSSYVYYKHENKIRNSESRLCMLEKKCNNMETMIFIMVVLLLILSITLLIILVI